MTNFDKWPNLRILLALFCWSFWYFSLRMHFNSALNPSKAPYTCIYKHFCIMSHFDFLYRSTDLWILWNWTLLLSKMRQSNSFKMSKTCEDSNWSNIFSEVSKNALPKVKSWLLNYRFQSMFNMQIIFWRKSSLVHVCY